VTKQFCVVCGAVIEPGHKHVVDDFLTVEEVFEFLDELDGGK
jgi:predicted nucleic acid-binding Zn ribbon protein